MPPMPADLADRPVAVWSQPVELLTYEPATPDPFPAFLDRRVYQGSSGRVYPLPFIDRIAAEPRPHRWEAIHLENRWIRAVILPELGGRIHVGFDKTSGHDFFYRNATIKPALVGLAGPWMAGGVEFNWPQHHRPATWLPVRTSIEEADDGSVTVWCSDHDPFSRMKGMHGVRLNPDAARLELVVRLYNRSDFTETFLWWANVAALATPDYQSFFPPDVTLVADHARRAVVGFPRADRPYYGIDYPARADLTFEAGGRPWTGDRLDFYRNIPVPTSYMCLGTRGGFFGGYDHALGSGFVHVSDPGTAVGKKQWTWGSHDFGRAWDRNLSDDGSAYVELMAGVYTDNQPDFAFLQPGETKTFTQAWIPISRIGVPVQASEEAVLSVEADGTTVRVGIVSARSHPDSTVEIEVRGSRRVHSLALAAGVPAVLEDEIPAGLSRDDVVVRVTTPGAEVVGWEGRGPSVERAAAQEPLAPADVPSVSELCRIATHLEQNRHATRSPEPYWQEALRRDPGNPEAATGLGVRRLRDAQYEDAVDLLEAAYSRLTHYNLNPPDTRTTYHLGLALARLGRLGDAVDLLNRAAWVQHWAAPALWQAARIECSQGHYPRAIRRLRAVLDAQPGHLQARAALVWALRRVGRTDEASLLVAESLQLDGLDAWLQDLAGEPLAADEQTHLDVALEYRALGDHDAARRVLRDSERAPQPDGAPRVGLIRDLLLGRPPAPQPWTFPNRLDEHDLLRAAEPAGAVQAALGCWLYAHGRRSDAISAWSAATDLDPGDAVSWRNLGLALYNSGRDIEGAGRCYDRARGLRPEDARLLYEADQLAALAGVPVAERLITLAPGGRPADRDDVVVAWANLAVTAGEARQVLDVLAQRRFQPWEGGEGQVLAVWDRAHRRRAAEHLLAGDPAPAVALLEAALAPPPTLGEARHLLANTAALHLRLGDALATAGLDGAEAAWTAAARQQGDFVQMSPEAFSEATYYSLQARKRLGDEQSARDGAATWAEWLGEWERTTAQPPYFATSLPDLLLFDVSPDDDKRRRASAMRAQLAILAGDLDTGRTLLAGVLAERPDHPEAADLLHDLAQGQP